MLINPLKEGGNLSSQALGGSPAADILHTPHLPNSSFNERRNSRPAPNTTQFTNLQEPSGNKTPHSEGVAENLIIYQDDRITISEVTPKSYFPEKLVLDDGIKLAMYHVNGENGRLIDEAAVVIRDVERAELTASQQEKAYSIYHTLYPAISLEEFTQTLQYHAVTFLYPHEGNLDDIDLTFGIAQKGRLNGLAVNLAQDDTTDQEAIIGLKRDSRTNVPLGVGTGRYKGLFLYDNPEIQFDKDGNQIIDSQKVPQVPEALLFIVPGRVTTKPVEIAPLPDYLRDQIGDWGGIVERGSKVVYLNELTPPQLETDEVPPTPHIVWARWGAVNWFRSGLENEEIRTQIAQKILEHNQLSHEHTEPSTQETNAIIPIEKFRDFARTRTVIEIPKDETWDDFTARMIAGEPLPAIPNISAFLLRLARSANNAAQRNGCEHKVIMGTDGESFLSTPLVQDTSDSVRDLDGIVSFDSDYAGFRKVLTFHNHPKIAGQKHAGFSLSDAEKIITQTPHIINALGTTTDLYIATAYPKTQVVDDPQNTTHEDIFGQQLYDDAWTDEQREQNVAAVFRKYGIRYLKYPLENPLAVVTLA